MNEPLMNRRLLLATGLTPVLAAAAPALPSEVDVAVIGAGAAGLAAARSLKEAGRSVIVLEAHDRVGGRCTSVTAPFSRAVDLGAHWLHNADRNPLVPLLKAKGLTLYDEPAAERLLIDGREAREGEAEDFVATRASALRAIGETSRKGKDISLAAAFADTSKWRPTLDFIVGPYDCGKDASAISAFDYLQAEDGPNMFCAEGYGTGLARLAEGLPVTLSTRVTAIDHSERLVRVDTDKGSLRARAVIVTLSTSCLARDVIRFKPALPVRHKEAAQKLSCGSYEHVIVEIAGNPTGHRADETVLARAQDERTFGLLARAGGSEIWYCDLAGRFSRDLWKEGRKAVEDAARTFIRNQLGLRAEQAITALHATDWQNDPFAFGSWSVADIGAANERRTLAQPVNDRLFLAGEATEPAFWGTVHGAWISGQKAAEAAARLTGRPVKPAKPRR